MNPGESTILLRRFEPVLRFTRGESFFPMRVNSYVSQSSLWVHRPGEEAELIIPRGELTLDSLAEPRAGGFDTVFFLKFVDPLTVSRLAELRLRGAETAPAAVKGRERFRTERGRLARVGYFSRLVDTLFSLTLLTRGRVTGDTAAAAALVYNRLLSEGDRPVYYGRVIRDAGWTILQYWYFYPFNNWRSGFFGLNDHESDWEMVSLYLWRDREGDLHPEWVAASVHDYEGDDLRRRWDDPDLERVGEHPVIYVGAGSHAGYFLEGEYVAELELPFLIPVGRAVDRTKEFLERLVRRERKRRWRSPSGHHALHVPFVDYARGDGVAIGPGGDLDWSSPELLEPAPGWAMHYRGLWGLYTRDIISGEDAPAGPRYNRDGSMRVSWYDPLGWVGLDREPLPSEALMRLQERRTRLEEKNATLRETAIQKSAALLARGAEAHALRDASHLREEYASNRSEMLAISAELDVMRARLAANEAIVEELDRYGEKLRNGYRSPPTAHLRRPPRPTSETELCLSRLAETWAALSIGLVMLGVVGLFVVAREYLGVGLTGLVIMIAVVEAVFRRRVQNLINTITVILAIVSSIVILASFFREIAIVMILLAGGYILVQNIRELNS